jgi:hypothetical protein
VPGQLREVGVDGLEEVVAAPPGGARVLVRGAEDALYQDIWSIASGIELKSGHMGGAIWTPEQVADAAVHVEL